MDLFTADNLSFLIVGTAQVTKRQSDGLTLLHLSGMQAPLMSLITPVLVLLSHVKLSAKEKVICPKMNSSFTHLL